MAVDALNKKRILGTVPVAVLMVALFVALVLMTDAIQNSEDLSRAFVPLLFIVLGGLLIMAGLVVVNIVKLLRRYRHQAAGSRLTLRLVVLFGLISLLPVGVVYYFSLGFLLRGIDSWFDVEIGRAMQDALTLNQASLDLNQRVLVKYTEALLSGIQDRSSTAIALNLNSLRRHAGAEELTVFGTTGQVLGTANQDPARLVPSYADREVHQGVRTGKNYVGTESGPGDELVVRLQVTSDRDYEFLELFDHRPSLTEPMDVLSGWRWADGAGWYLAIREASTQFFFERLPRGTHVLEYSLRAAHRGKASSGFATLRSRYAPEFSAHSASIPVEVK